MKVNTSLEVYVSENALLEVTRGPHLTVAQAYGIDWQSAPMVNVHPASMRALTQFQPKNRRRFVDWLVPIAFVFGVVGAVWLVMR